MCVGGGQEASFISPGHLLVQVVGCQLPTMTAWG